jgi:hypothetical protein
MTVASRLPEIVTIANCQLIWQINKKEPGLFRVVVFARSCKMSWMTWENTAESWSTLARFLGVFSLQMSDTLNDVNYQDLPRTAMSQE